MEKYLSLLKQIQGLVAVELLKSKHKEKILSLEDKNNLGVHSCLQKQHIFVVIHDSSFRDPFGELVLKEKDNHYFPALPFPELEHVHAISSSPSQHVHDFLIKAYGFSNHPEYATLLIAFD